MINQRRTVEAARRLRPWLLPVGVIGCLGVILVPLPPALMDLLLAGNISLAVIILLTAIHVDRPLEFNVFPTVLLATTLARLVLNIATTRMILTGVPTLGDQAAGGVIQTFGRFVAGNQVEVGLIVFLILVLVQFVVITKGATRISEVAARFALDGMPGRQAAIDADLAAGSIDASEASRRRAEMGEESDFYAAMDGAGKFVRGDAIAGLAITVINILGGLYLGIVVHGMDLSQCFSTITRLTIGDGLVSQVPSLMISLAAGVLVTRGTAKINLADNVVSQLLGHAKPLMVAGGFLAALTLTGLPLVPLLLLAGGCFLIANGLRRQERQHAAEAARQESQSRQAASAQQKRVEDFLAVDPLEVAIGLGLLPLADPHRGGDLMQRIATLRNQMAAEVGIVLPKVRVRDDATLGEQEYEIRLFGDFVARGQLRPDQLLATSDGRTTGRLAGEPVRDAIVSIECSLGSELTTAQEATWIDPSAREQALIYGYKTRTAPAVLADHLEHVARTHADELLSHDATKHLLDELRQVAPALVEELVPGRLRIADVQKVLQGLLRESIPIRQLGLILEAVGEASEQTPDPDQQVEWVRQRLSRTLCGLLRDADRTLHAVGLDASAAAAMVRPTGADGSAERATVAGDKRQDITCDAIRRAVKKLSDRGYPPIVVVDADFRRRVKQKADQMGLAAHVLSHNEISYDSQLKFHDVVRLDTAPVAA